MRYFPIIGSSCFKAVPWAMVAECEQQLRKNHCGQSVERLAERGGLSAVELVCAMNKTPVDKTMPDEIAERFLAGRLTAELSLRVEVLYGA